MVGIQKGFGIIYGRNNNEYMAVSFVCYGIVLSFSRMVKILLHIIDTVIIVLIVKLISGSHTLTLCSR